MSGENVYGKAREALKRREPDRVPRHLMLVAPEDLRVQEYPPEMTL